MGIKVLKKYVLESFSLIPDTSLVFEYIVSRKVALKMKPFAINTAIKFDFVAASFLKKQN